jgi:hypothetical protein
VTGSFFICLNINGFDGSYLTLWSLKGYISANNDHVVFEYNNGMRNVYYINNNFEYDKIHELIKLIPNNNINLIVVCDVKNVMDDIFGYLYCEPK